MQTITVVVGPDGRVEIPGTRVGQTVTIQVAPATEQAPVAAQRSPEEKERLIQELLEGGRRVRAAASPEQIERAVNHGDWLYGPDGLPR